MLHVKDQGSWTAAAAAAETRMLSSGPEASVPTAQPTATPELHGPRLSPQCPAHRPAQVAEIRLEMELRDEILPRAQNIQSRLDRQTIETEEVGMLRLRVGTGTRRHGAKWLWSPLLLPSDLDFCPSLVPQVSKTLKATLQVLLEAVAAEDGDALDSLQASPSTESLKSTSSDVGARQAGRRRGQQQETETFYITVGRGQLGGRRGAGRAQSWDSNFRFFFGLPRNCRST